MCEGLNVPQINHEAFKSSTFGLLLQFNGNLDVNLSPKTTLNNITTGKSNGKNISFNSVQQDVSCEDLT